MTDQIPERIQILNTARDFVAAGEDLQSQFGRMCQEILVMQKSINQLSLETVYRRLNVLGESKHPAGGEESK